jgi:UDP-galactopyranose mutase
MIERLLDHKNIKVMVNTRLSRQDAKAYQHTFYSGPLDEWFGYAEGRLGYRTLEFLTERYEGDFQGNAVINYCDEEIAWTRICEHKHFASWENHERTLIYREHSRACQEGDVPCYPIPIHEYQDALDSYARMAADETAVTFDGRLATYRYLDMDTTIAEALSAAEAHRVQCPGVVHSHRR